MVFLAGRETEQAWLMRLTDRPRTWESMLHVGGADDLRTVVDLAEYVTGGDEEMTAYICWLTERCRKTTWRSARTGTGPWAPAATGIRLR
jgi:hypothetical protein